MVGDGRNVRLSLRLGLMVWLPFFGYLNMMESCLIICLMRV